MNIKDFSYISATADMNKMGLANAIYRDKAIPLERWSVFGSYDEASSYVDSKGLAYEGQVVVISGNGGQSAYIVDSKAPDGLKKLASGADVDDVISNYLDKRVGGEITGDVIIKGHDFTILSGNYVQTTTPENAKVFGTNSFLQAEEAFNGKGESYGKPSIGSKGFIVVEIVSAENKVLLSVDGLSSVSASIPTSCYNEKWSIALDNMLDAQFSQISDVGSNYVIFKNAFNAVASYDGKPLTAFTELLNKKDDNALYCPTHPEVGNLVIPTFTSNHAEGGSTHATAQFAHAEGRASSAEGRYSHAEGHGTIAAGTAAHVEGMFAKALHNHGVHAEGYYSQATGDYGSHAEGISCVASGKHGSHAEGLGTTAKGEESHAEGAGTHAFGNGSHAEGYQTNALCAYSHAEGYQTKADATYTHAEGYMTSATYEGTHVEGYRTLASEEGAHAEGRETIASGKFAHAEGGYYESNTYTKGGTASGAGSHAEGILTQSIGVGSHAEGRESKAQGNYSHAEGGQYKIGTGYLAGGWANNYGAHAEGVQTSAFGIASHAQGFKNIANKNYSFAGGQGSKADGNQAFAFGNGVSALGGSSFATGYMTNASADNTYCLGVNAKATNVKSFVWSGQSSSTPYTSQKDGSFNINPANGISGFYIGTRSLYSYLSSVEKAASDELTSLRSAISSKINSLSTIDGLTYDSDIEHVISAVITIRNVLSSLKSL